MALGGSGQRGGDYSRAIEKHNDPNFDFRKGVRRAIEDTAEIESGATEASIAGFVEATTAAKASRDAEKPGVMTRLRRFVER